MEAIHIKHMERRKQVNESLLNMQTLIEAVPTFDRIIYLSSAGMNVNASIVLWAMLDSLIYYLYMVCEA